MRPLSSSTQRVSAAAIVCVLSLSSAAHPDEANTEPTLANSVKLGEWRHGPKVKLSRLKGRVVVVMTIMSHHLYLRNARLHHLDNWNRKFAARGVTVIVTVKPRAEHALRVWHTVWTSDWRFTITEGGSVSLPDYNPSQTTLFVFGADGKLVDAGSLGELQKTVLQLFETEPHFVMADRKYEHFAKYDAALKRGLSYGAAIARIKKEAGKKRETLEEAKHLVKRMQRLGKSRLSRARKLEKADLTEAIEAYELVAREWKGEKVGARARSRVDKLRSDADVQRQLKSLKIAAAILKRFEDFRFIGHEIKPENPHNQRVRARIEADAKAMLKHYAGTQGARKVKKQLKRYSIELPAP